MFIITSILFLFGINSFPQHKIGDCVISKGQNKRIEFIREDIRFRKIEKVGERNYLYKFGSELYNEVEISYADAHWIKTKCPEGF